ncbi:MAG TPA: hypothetical protein VH277_11340 [Gemmatimonadaceae bacterium]|nr:hypothetical protein [Gemmatimonadaceae bacterium]
MLPRTLWTSLLVLLAWLPIGQAASRGVRVGQEHRTLFAITALDVATESPARAAEPGSLLRDVAPDRRPAPPRVGPKTSADAEQRVWSPSSSWRPATSPQPSGWRGFREKRLILPHDATAPPAVRS